MPEIPYVCLYSRYLQTLAPFTDAERGRIMAAMLIYSTTGESPTFDGNERFIWPTIQAQIDRDAAVYQEKCAKNRANGAKGGRPPKNPTDIAETKRFLEKPKKANTNTKKNTNRNTKSNDMEADKPPALAKIAFSQYGWVKLRQEEYDRLVADLGEVEVKRCIAYVDELAQTTNNKNKWRDWNLVVRKCSRDGWGQKTHNTKANQMPSYGGEENWSL